MKAVKLPVEIEWYPATEEYYNEITEWSSEERPILYSDKDKNYTITTLEGVMIATKNDVIIKGVSGECYPCKLDIFNKTYKTL